MRIVFSGLLSYGPSEGQQTINLRKFYRNSSIRQPLSIWHSTTKPKDVSPVEKGSCLMLVLLKRGSVIFKESF